MPQLTEQTKAALEFASRMGAAEGDTAVRSVLLSAWNENDEGHWIIPSLQQGPAKLEAVAKAITAHKQRRESYWQKLKTDDKSSRPDVGAIYCKCTCQTVCFRLSLRQSVMRTLLHNSLRLGPRSLDGGGARRQLDGVAAANQRAAALPGPSPAQPAD